MIRQITSITTHHSPLKHTPYFEPHTHTHHVVTHGFVDRPRSCDATAARWTEKLAGGPQAGRSDPHPLAMVKGVVRQKQQQ